MAKVFEGLCFAAATTLLAALGGLIVSLAIGGWPALRKFGFGFLTSTTWNPVTDVYGAAGPIVGTLITAALALTIALPIAGGVAFFLTELCPAPLRRPKKKKRSRCRVVERESWKREKKKKKKKKT